MAKEIVRIVVSAGQIVGKAFTRALRREIEQSQQAAKARAASGASNADSHRAAAEDALTGMTVQEAKQILDINDVNDTEEFMKKYDHLFKVNEKTKGGSFYIQSKVVMAKERIEQETQSTGNQETTDNQEKT